MIEDRKIDLHLLRCLDVLIAEGSVTRAAERMDMSQPGMSNALARLREVFGDPLLVRTPKGMEPTDRALVARDSVREALDRIEGALAGDAEFDPATASLNVTIATTDYASFVLMPPLMARLAAEAPGMTLTIRPPDLGAIREWLQEGSGELVIGFLPNAAETLKTSTLYRERLVAVARPGHPEIDGVLSLEAFAAARHVIFGSAFSGLSTLESHLDELLEAEGIVRDAGMRIPSALLSPHLVASSDMIAILPERFVRSLEAGPALQMLELPFDVPELPVAMIWHERTQQSGAMAWLREKLREVARSV
ncbi:MAG: LysR family transcriptional regulator [Alphaproteobacteria bacterium]|nr:LysR family transcriptional regulator [Alphaproteobacteria bacterium]